MAVNHCITRERALELFDYDAETGRLVWKARANNNGVPAGKEAGSFDNGSGYRIVGADGKKLFVHRVAFLIAHGYLPPVIDHINQDKTDNRICNLRPADKRLNAFNAKMLTSNTSGYRGVSLESKTGKWVARINDGKRYRMIGRYVTKEDAAEAYRIEAIAIAGDFLGPQHR